MWLDLDYDSVAIHLEVIILRAVREVKYCLQYLHFRRHMDSLHYYSSPCAGQRHQLAQ